MDKVLKDGVVYIPKEEDHLTEFFFESWKDIIEICKNHHIILDLTWDTRIMLYGNNIPLDVVWKIEHLLLDGTHEKFPKGYIVR